MNKEAILATKQTLLLILGVLIVVGISWYAALHPFFMLYILIPIFCLAMLVAVWFFFYIMAKIK